MSSDRPRVGFRRHLASAVVPGDATYLVSEQGVTAIASDALSVLAPLLDGSRDIPALVRDTQGLLSPAQLGSLLGRLTEENLVRQYPAPHQADSQDGAAAAAFWESAGLEPVREAYLLESGSVRLVNLTSIADRAVRDAFASSGVRIGPDDRSELTVVLCEHYLAAELEEIDRQHRRSGRPWLLTKPHGVEVWTGPVFQPGSGACWSCLAYRLRHHRQAEQHAGAVLGLGEPLAPPPAATAASRSLALQLVAMESAKWLCGYRHENQGAVWTLDSLRMAGTHHRVERRPQCPECGDPGLMGARTWQPLPLSSRLKKTRTGGGHRTLTPRQVLARYEHLVSGITGVVSTLQPDPRCPESLNSYTSGANPALRGTGMAAMRSGLRIHSGGKGVTELDAKVGALCEALERYSATFHGDEPRVRSSFAELGGTALHPNLSQLYHERQFAQRHLWNAVQPFPQHVCDPFDENTVIDWTPVWSVSHGNHRMVPTSMLYYAAPQPAGANYARADSNGNAAGCSLEDAVLQGFFELVERDSVALWWYNRTRQPGVDLDSFGDPWFDEMRSWYAELHREFWVLDLTADLGIPTMAAVSRCTKGPYENIVFGFGSHFDPALALRRALTEMNQLLPAMTETAPGEGYAFDDPTLLDWCLRKTLANQPYLTPDPGAPARRRTDYDYTPREDLLDDINAAERLVRARGMELLVLDQTRPDIQIPVVKVIVPGLRHFWARYAPGRLFDVPVRLGRRNVPIAYEEINPIPLFV
ncbi:TOMM precursor leader peptide-binding protein [Streptomyces sp. NBC_01142]|uniref:TOMM precursor leader peptide-binding protein n=1 Tax=Streptomyces sp. NBC_01142 TaxID=2975865 RepID=UPI002258F796|nr:TOMM precursor leader peptide-binding protein [Streptomyces sp. NBC_01142]MCX4820524.1 TOMM precursor leader peptide-binding protein [Streptomyces sp. NBC_01142]